MSRTVVRGLAWLLSSSVLLTLGFLTAVYAASLLLGQRLEAESVRTMQIALVIYARTVLVKGLLPQLALALVIFGVADRALAIGERGGARQVGALVGSAALAASIVASTVMTADWPELPAVVFRSAGHFARTVVEMTFGVTAALIVPRWLFMRRLRK